MQLPSSASLAMAILLSLKHEPFMIMETLLLLA